jgi:hypothetical protein
MGGDGGVQLRRAETGTAAEAGLQLDLEQQRSGIRVRREPDADVVEAVLEVLVRPAGVQPGRGAGRNAVVGVAQRVAVADLPFTGEDVVPDVQFDQARVLVQRLGEVLERRRVVRVVRADGGRLGEPAVRAGGP